jgi:asparagine synthase (glutamine-hydrolysing)
MGAPFIHVRMAGGVPSVAGVSDHTVGRRDANGTPVPGFARWHWDGRALTVENCRYGLRPLFYYVDRDEICVSTSIEMLLERGAPAELDTEALAAMYRLNWFLADDTPFKAIRTVPPDARFRWDGALSLQSALRIVPASSLSRDDAIDGYIERFRRAVERHHVNGALLPLSGGRDSRHILFELCRIGPPRLCVTVKDPPPWPDPSDNTVCALQLTAMLGIEHAVLDYIPDVVSAERRKNALSNLCTIEHAWYMAVHDRLAREDGRVFDGLGGDYLSAGGGLDVKAVEILRGGRIDDLATHMLVRRRVPDLSFLRDPRPFSFEAAQARVRRELDRHLDATNPIGSFFFWNRVRRGIGASAFGIMAARDVCTPFVEHDVFDLLTSLPVEMYLDKTFHTEAIQRAFPQYNHVPFESKKKTPAANPRLYLLRNWLHLLGHAVRWGRATIDLPHVAPRLFAYALTGKAKPVWYDNAAVYAIQLAQMVARH